VSPFPEFIQDPWGWLVDIPTKKNDGLEYTDTDNLANHKLLSEALIEGLYSTIKHIIADRNLLRDKCSKAIQRIKDFHGPMDRVQVLCDIYKNAIN
jgi:hypothetical protein